MLTGNKFMNKLPLISIIVPTYNRCQETIACLNSILRSDYANYEIIVVNNGSTDKTQQLLKEKFQDNLKIKLISIPKNLGAGGGRNLGAQNARGEYLLFIDSDNVIDYQMISHLITFFSKQKDCGMAGPLMLYKKNPDLIWLYYADINMYTSQAFYKGTGEKNLKQYEKIIKGGHLPNCFMVKKKDFKQLNGFDEKYFIMYEEAELAEKIKKYLKKNIYIYTKAITYHDVEPPIKTKKNVSLRSPERAYLTGRNRIYFMKKNANLLQKIIFFAIFLPVLFLYYEFNLIKNKQFASACKYWQGNWAGLKMK